jgi:hypothetical protein
MARKAKKRAWTAADVRNLKGFAKEKTPASEPICCAAQRAFGSAAMWYVWPRDLRGR